MSKSHNANLQSRELLFSPLRRFQKQHCQQCTQACNPTEQRFLTCILAGIFDTIERSNNLNQNRGAHY